MKKRSEVDQDYLYKIERAIAKKFGEDTIASPLSSWTPEKEKEYLSALRQQFLTEKEEEHNIEKHEGFSIRRLLFIKEKRICSCCETYSFKKQDDLFLNKFDVCAECYYKYIEGREDRWNSGWRPTGEK